MGDLKVKMGKVDARFDDKVCWLQQLVDVQSNKLREMQQRLKDEGEKIKENNVRIEAMNSLFMNQQPLLEVLGRNVQGMQGLLAMDRDKREADP